MNRLSISLLVGMLLTSPAFAEPAAEAPQPSAAALEIEKAAQLENRGEYLEAQKLYESLLQDSALAGEEKMQIQEKYESLNLRLLFSKFETPDSAVHTVASGDNLYEIAKKYKTTIELVKKSNGLQKDTIYPGMKLKVETGTLAVHVDRSDNVLTIFLNDKAIKHYRVATGVEATSTPLGQFQIMNKLENPTWFKAGAIVPPDSPENILGTRWLGFDHPGYGIHGTTLPESIGKHATSGCVRMLNHEVEELYAILPVGTKVTISE